jgi:aspartyl-tRNA(Asn)/glutamyl-tRNA(Gln) amidotransferase subunit A
VSTAKITSASATQLQDQIRTGELRAADVTDAFLTRIAAVDHKVGAFLEVFEDTARQEAEAVDAARARGARLGPLCGVPVAVKDIFTRKGHRVSCASKILDGFVSPYTSTAVARLEAAGAVILGRTNMDEFAMGSSTEHSAFRTTHNPFDPTRIPGGSSGGSAAAVSARMAPLALGSDTGGSVRQPAALCGISGLKPTYGRISRFGLVAYASSLDHVAPFAHQVSDLALVLGVLAGVDPNDSTSLDEAVPDYTAARQNNVAGLRVGVPEEYFAEGLDTEIESLARAALQQLEQLGCELVQVSLPHTRYAIPAYYLIATSEASSNLARYDGVRYGQRGTGGGDSDAKDLDAMYRATRTAGFGDEVKLRILLGSFCLRSGHYDAYYLKATKVRTLIRQDFEAAFESCDVLATPTSPIPAFRLGEKLEDPLAMYLCDTLTAPANLAGIPGISIPSGFTKAGLPAGLQILGPVLGEPTVLQVAQAYQDATHHHRREPEL